MLVAIASIGCGGCGGCGPRHVDPPSLPPTAYEVGHLRIVGAPRIDPAIARAYDTRPPILSARLFDLAGDGRLLASTGMGCVAIAVDMSVHPTRRACRGAVAWAGFGVSPAYVVHDAAERSHLFVGDAEVRIPAGRIDGAVWNRARDTLVFALARSAPAELWTWNADRGVHRIAGDGPWLPLDASPDDRFVLARRERSTSDVGIYQIELATGHAIAIAPHAHAGRFVTGGAAVVALDGDGSHGTLERDACDATGCRRTVVARVPGEIAELAIATTDAREYAIAIVDHAGTSTPWLIDLASARARPIASATAGGTISELHAAGSRIAYAVSTPTAPRAIEVLALDHADAAEPRRVGRWPADPPPPAIAPSIHELVAADGVRAQVISYLPPAASRAAPAPVVIELHGGPEDRWRPGYDAFAQWLVSRGYAVLRPNVRGSAGQGRAFEALDDGARRADVLRDVLAVADWIARRPELDASRVVAMGTSYGGYLALASVLAFPDRLRGAITMGAITDLAGFLDGTASYRREHRRAEYGDERDPRVRARLDELSPITHVASLRRPVLVAYGLRDPRVPPATSARFVRAARATGADVWSIAATDEGHWFEYLDNRRVFDVLVVQFLDAATRR